MISGKNSFLVLFLAVLCFGCQPIMYIPNMQNTPFLKEKGEFKATVNTSNLQASYAITDEIAVMANGYFNSKTYDLDYDFGQREWKNSRYFVEGGVGYYRNLSDQLVFETYAGGGIGGVDYGYVETTNQGDEFGKNLGVNLSKFFVQPNIGLSTEYIDFGFTSRIVGISYSNMSTSFTDLELESNELAGIEGPLFLFIEPGVTFRAGHKWVKFHTQLFYSAQLTQHDLNYREVIFNIGLTFNIANRFKEAE